MVFRLSASTSSTSGDSLIHSSIKHGQLAHALYLYQQTPAQELSERTFVALLRACTKLNDMERGCQLHADVARNGLLETNLFVSNSLMHMYVKCGSIKKAQEVFCMLPVRDPITWTVLIGGYAEINHGWKALNFLWQMRLESMLPNAVTFICSLKACGSIRAIAKGRELHAEIVASGFLEEDPGVGNALLDMYAKCGSLSEARELFDNLPLRNVVSWNSLISAYMQHEHGSKVFRHFEQMQIEGVFPNSVTFICTLHACGCVETTRKGTHVHAVILSQGLLESDLALGNALLDMYAKCGCVAKAQEVFDWLPARDVVTWTALIAGYTHHQRSEEALNMFEKMKFEEVTPNETTFALSLNACGCIGDTDRGKEMHVEVMRRGLIEGHPMVGNALIDMYAKCGLLAIAQEVFDELKNRDVVSWNSLITGYVQQDEGEGAVHYFRQMQDGEVPPNVLTYICSLNACGSIGALDIGREIHDDIVVKGLLKDQIILGTALADMYVKCGLLVRAESVFDELPFKDLVSWNSLTTGYAHLGELDNVLWVIERLKAEGKEPDMISFLNVLKACSYAGLVDEGERYFKTMSKDLSVSPPIEHHICMLDLLSRAGQLDKAVKVMKDIPFHPNSVMLIIVLGACRKWGNVELGIRAFEEALQIDEKEAAAYICMFNVVADAEMQE